MQPSGALIFKLEQCFFRVNLDYAEVLQQVRGELRAEEAPLGQGLAASMLALKRQLGKKAYEGVRSRAETAAETLEARSLAGAQMHPGVVKMLEQVRDTGWWVVAATDLGKKPITEFLESKSLGQYMNRVVARSRLDQDVSLSARLRPVRAKLKTLSTSVYFCNSSREVKEAKALGMKCFVLPSPVEPFRTLYQAGPDGIILSLEEVPPLLSLPSMKLPELPKPEPRKVRRARRVRRKTARKRARKTP